MNLKSTFFLLLIATLLFTCESPKEQTVEVKFIDCLPSEAQADYKALLTAFDNFLQSDYNGSIDSFSQIIINLNLPEKTNFTKEDIELGKQMMKNNFTKTMYATYNDTTYHSVFSKVKGKTEKKPRVNKLLKVSKEKPYFSCFLEVMPKDDPLRSFIDKQEINSALLVLQDFAWKPGYDISSISESGMLRIMLATELYSGMLMRSK